MSGMRMTHFSHQMSKKKKSGLLITAWLVLDLLNPRRCWQQRLAAASFPEGFIGKTESFKLTEYCWWFRDEGFHLLHIGAWDNDFRFRILSICDQIVFDDFLEVLKSWEIGLI
jgi:hypothetical protein